MMHHMATRRTILVVDDDEDTRSIFDEILTRAGYRVLVCGTASDGLNAALNDQVDATVADVVLPDWTGIDMVRQLKELRPTAKVLFVSGYLADWQPLLELRDDPAVCYLTKPVPPTQLLATVNRTLS